METNEIFVVNISLGIIVYLHSNVSIAWSMAHSLFYQQQIYRKILTSDSIFTHRRHFYHYKINK